MFFVKRWALILVTLILVPFCSDAQLKWCYPFGGQPASQLIKTNLLALPFKSFNLEYEREIASRISVGIGVTYTPTSGLPLKGIWKDYIKDEDPEEKNNFSPEDIRYNHISIKPSARYYFGKRESFERFYATGYLKYSRYQPDFSIKYQTLVAPDEDPMTFDITYGGAINTLSIGYGIGFQFRLTDQFYLDWQVIGNHYGLGFGAVTGSNPEHPIPIEVQNSINKSFEDLDDIPFYNVSGNVNAERVELSARGPMVGLTMGLSIGYRIW